MYRIQLLASIPFGSEYPLGDCGRCRNWENAILTLKLGAYNRGCMCGLYAPSFMC